MFPAYVGMSPETWNVCNLVVRVPRIRGDEPAGAWEDEPDPQVFPAYVGMSPDGGDDVSDDVCVPRIRGDEPSKVNGRLQWVRCSPHTWG